ncbi:MAG TPA: metal-dependent hydrolase [Deinococcales bacterium]|nr:metal-dependent hydrolase [Deinococcales bacterium]
MNLRFLGHAAFLLEGGGHSIVIDPFISGNPVCPVGTAELAPEAVIVTHAHGDHWGSTMDFAQRGAMVVSTPEICGYAQARGAKATRGMNIGGSARFDWGSVYFTPAWHSNSFPDGTYGGMPTGVVVEMDGKRIYHAGDTNYFTDMQLIGERGLDLALLPIGDNFTMGPEEAVRAAVTLKPRRVVPMHYNTFPVIRQDPQVFLEGCAARGVAALVLQPGESLTL